MPAGEPARAFARTENVGAERGHFIPDRRLEQMPLLEIVERLPDLLKSADQVI
jgi:hypothetical protein